jgi:hypothetical protein
LLAAGFCFAVTQSLVAVTTDSTVIAKLANAKGADKIGGRYATLPISVCISVELPIRNTHDDVCPSGVVSDRVQYRRSFLVPSFVPLCVHFRLTLRRYALPASMFFNDDFRVSAPGVIMELIFSQPSVN